MWNPVRRYRVNCAMMVTGVGITGFGSVPEVLVEFGILGPVEVRESGRLIDAGHAKQRAVLAVLLLDLGRAVSPELLIDRVWGEEPPVSVRNVLYGYLARLRKVIAAGADPQVQLTRSGGGYLLRAPAGRLDLDRFRALAADAAQPGDDQRAKAGLREALGLWRGPALADLDSRWLRAMRATLEGERAAALLELNEARLRLGEHAALASELSGQAAACPSDERLVGQLMLALYRCGRQAAALGRFEQVRQHLAAELGADPGPELRSLHQRMLRADPALAAPRPDESGPARTASPPVPRQLPPDVSAFTGRATELAYLDQLIDTGTPATVVISAVSGTAGVGKTALALHFAHRAAGRFGDGQLYVNLRGFASSGTPATPTEAVRGFLDALGVPPERIPAGADAQAGLYRSLLADKRMLIVLDNARDEAQVRPLLPASPASCVLVTSRNQLTGLAAADSARVLSLDVLAHAEAVQLLTARIGAARTAAEPGAVNEIAALCARLPLALAVTAARAAARPGFPLAALAAELRDSAGRLDALDVGDPAVNVRVVFSWSYKQLTAQAARMFRLLGLHAGPDISVAAAASLAAAEPSEARRLLGELTRLHLIAEHVPGRYAFHDLLRAYAGGQARDCDSEPERREAIGRVLDHYLHSAAAGAFTLTSTFEPVTLHPPRPGAALQPPAGPRGILTWFDAEHLTLLAAVGLAAESGFDRHAWQLPWAMTPFLRKRGHWREWVATQRTALAAATRLGDLAGQAVARRLLATAHDDLGDYELAYGSYMTSLELYQRLGDRCGQARSLAGLGVLAARQGRYRDALGYDEQSLRLYQAVGNKALEAVTLYGIGWDHGLLGDFEQARALCRQALALNGDARNHDVDAAIWDCLGHAEHNLGNLTEAAACYQRALGIIREFGDRWRESVTLIHLGDTYWAASDPPRAHQAWQQALAILEDLNHPDAAKARARLSRTPLTNSSPLTGNAIELPGSTLGIA